MKVWKIRYVDGVVHTVAAQTSLIATLISEQLRETAGRLPSTVFACHEVRT